jgi:hypothetical protein
VHADMMNGHTVFLQKYIYKMKVHLNIKILMQFLHQKVILTKYNRSTCNRSGCKKCAFGDSMLEFAHIYYMKLDKHTRR